MSTNPTGADTSHECPHGQCISRIARQKLACPTHWYALPANLRIDLTAAYRETRIKHATTFEDNVATRAHLDAVATALDWYRANT